MKINLKVENEGNEINLNLEADIETCRNAVGSVMVSVFQNQPIEPAKIEEKKKNIQLFWNGQFVRDFNTVKEVAKQLSVS